MTPFQLTQIVARFNRAPKSKSSETALVTMPREDVAALIQFVTTTLFDKATR